jgi:hypothetical protein
MSGLVGIGSPPTPHPVNSTSDIGSIISLSTQTAARAMRGSRVAALDATPSLIMSLRV